MERDGEGSRSVALVSPPLGDIAELDRLRGYALREPATKDTVFLRETSHGLFTVRKVTDLTVIGGQLYQYPVQVDGGPGGVQHADSRKIHVGPCEEVTFAA